MPCGSSNHSNHITALGPQGHHTFLLMGNTQPRHGHTGHGPYRPTTLYLFPGLQVPTIRLHCRLIGKEDTQPILFTHGQLRGLPDRDG
jgi:hypothetical protein